MATSDFKIFANGQSLVGEETLNIAPLDDEALISETKTGFYSGLASSKKFNRVLRQGTAGTATIADLIVDVLAEDVKDDGTPLKDQLRRAITKIIDLDDSYVRKVNGITADSNGDLKISTGVQTVNSNSPDGAGNISPEQTGCLPLTGGDLLGEVQSSDVVKAKAFLANAKGPGAMLFANTSGNNFDGATLQLFKRNNPDYAGSFFLRASTRTSASSDGASYDLIGKPDGSLTWAGQDLTVDYTQKYQAGSTWGIKFKNGLIIQHVSCTTNGAEVSLPYAFSNTYYSAQVIRDGTTKNDYSRTDRVIVRTTTSVACKAYDSNTAMRVLCVGF